MTKNSKKKVRNSAIIVAALGLSAGGAGGMGVVIGQSTLGGSQSSQKDTTENLPTPPLNNVPETPPTPEIDQANTVQAIYNEVVSTYFNTITLSTPGIQTVSSNTNEVDVFNAIDEIGINTEIPLDIDALSLQVKSQENFLLLLFNSLDDPVYNAFFNTGTVSDVSFNGVRLRISNSDLDDQLLGTYDTEITIDGLSLNFNPFGNPNDPEVAAFTQRLEYGRQLGEGTDVPILGSILIDDITIEDDEVDLEDVELIGDEQLRNSIPAGTEALLEIFRVQYFNASTSLSYPEGDFRNDFIDPYIFPNFMALISQLGLFITNIEDFDTSKITNAQVEYYNSDNTVFIDPNNSNSLQITLQVQKLVLEYDGQYYEFNFVEKDYRAFIIFNLVTAESGDGYSVNSYGSLSLNFNDALLLEDPDKEPGIP